MTTREKILLVPLCAVLLVVALSVAVVAYRSWLRGGGCRRRMARNRGRGRL